MYNNIKALCDYMAMYSKTIKIEYYNVYCQNILVVDFDPNKILFRSTMNSKEGRELYNYCVVTFDMIAGNKIADLVKYIHKVISIACELSLEEEFYDRKRKYER